MSTSDPNFTEFKEKLEAQHKFPSIYLFKFIYLTDTNRVEDILALFDKENDQYSIKPSTKGKYSSLSIQRNVKSADEVVALYIAVSKMEGVISL